MFESVFFIHHFFIYEAVIPNDSSKFCIYNYWKPILIELDHVTEVEHVIYALLFWITFRQSISTPKMNAK